VLNNENDPNKGPDDDGTELPEHASDEALLGDKSSKASSEARAKNGPEVNDEDSINYPDQK
jgi:hypothetical protein